MTWGENTSGQLGDGTTVTRWTPALVPGTSGTVSVGAGNAHTLAATVGGRIRAWGSNASGQLGDGSAASMRMSPVLLPEPRNVTAVTAAFFHSVALGTDGAYWAWGANHAGQLGDGTTTARRAPVAPCGTEPVPVPAVPSTDAGVVSTCRLVPTANGLTVLVAEAHAFDGVPAVAMTVECTASGPLNERITVRANSLGPVVTGVSGQIMTSGVYTVCSWATATWLDGIEQRTETEQQHCAPG